MPVPQPKVPRCGHCQRAHMTVAQARLCAQRYYAARATEAEGHAQQQAELAAEQRYERWLEDGGPHAEIIQWENEQDRLRGGF